MAQQFGLRRVAPPSPDVTRAAQALLVAAERDASEIVAAARADVQRTILKAEQELLALNAQVRTTVERLEGSVGEGRDTGLLDASLVLREAQAQLQTLSIEPRPTGVVVTHPSVQVTPAPPTAALSPYEMENAGGRIEVPVRAARSRSVVPALAIVLAALLFVGAWAWTRGWLQLPRATEPRSTADETQPVDALDEPSSRATGMIGRTPRSAPAEKPERNASGSRPPATAAEATAIPRTLPPAENTPPAVRQELLNAAERWLDAYYLQDAARMKALSTPAVTLSDERKPEERLPAGLSGVRRTLSDATVQVFGSDAILTAKITERSDVSGRESASFISQMWTRRGGVWQVTDVRVVSAASVARAFKR